MATTSTNGALMYLRQSLNKTGEEQSVAVQRVTNTTRLTALGIQHCQEYKDDDRPAGRGKKREDWNRLLDDITAGKHDRKLLAIDHQDRLSRSVLDLLLFKELLVKHHMKLLMQSGVIDPEDDDGEVMMIINAAFAQKEVKRKGRRQKAANKYMAETKGRPWWPQRPFGFDADPDPVTGKWWTIRRDPSSKEIIAVNEIREHPTEADLLRKAYQQFNAGASIRSLAALWNDEGVTTPRGNKWTPSAVHQLLAAARNAGLREYDGGLIEVRDDDGNAVGYREGTWPAIVSEATWRTAMRRLKDPARRNCASRGRKNLLTNIALCGVCRTPLASSKNSRGVRLYVCASPDCRKIVRGAENLDNLIIEAVVRRLSREDAVELLRPPVEEVDTNALREERRTLEDRLVQLGKEFATAPPAFTQAALAEIQARLDAINGQLTDPGKARIYEDVIGAKDVRKAFESLDLGRRRTIVSALMAPVVMPVGRKAGKLFNPDAILPGWKT